MVVLSSVIIGALIGAALFGVAMVHQAKTGPDEVTNHPVRRTLWETIRGRPGVRKSELKRAVGENRGTTDYHLFVMERSGIVRASRVEHATRYFSADVDAKRVPVIAFMLSGRVMELVGSLLAQPGVSQHELTARLRMRRKLFRKYANTLLRHELITESRQGHRKTYHATPQLRILATEIESIARSRGPGGSSRRP